MSKHLLALVYLACALFDTVLTVMTYRKKTLVAKTLGTAMLFSLLTVTSYACYLLNSNYMVASICHSLEFISIDLVLVSLLRFASVYCDLHKNKQYWLIPMYILAGIDTLILITNPWHERAISYNLNYYDGEYYFGYVKKPLFNAHLAFSYFLLVLFFAIFIYKCCTVAFVYTRKYLLISVSILVIVLVNAIFLYVASSKGPDTSILFYTVYCVILYFYTFVYHPKILTTQVRSQVFTYISTPIVLFDNEDFLIDMSECTARTLPIDHKNEYEMKLTEFLTLMNLQNMQITGELESSAEISLLRGSKNFYYRVHYKLLRDSHDRILGKFFVFHDLTKQTEMYNTLEQLANVDSLTGLYNKHHFDNTLIEFDKNETLPISIVVCDIDSLKTINSVFGEAMGDHVIWYVATSIRAAAPTDAYLARLDGDETVMILPHTSENIALDLARSILSDIEHWHSFEFELSIAFGVACKTEAHDDNLQHLLSTARNNMICKKLLNHKSTKSSLVTSLMKTLSQSDFETEEHCERVKTLSRMVGIRMGLSDADLTSLELLAILHDIGKLSIPSNLLRKPGKLTVSEWELMKQHTIKGYHIANTSQELSSISNLILCHHERWDGTGYPNELKETAIPLLSRILTVVDSFDVMTHDRPYHSAIPVTDALLELKACSGSQFDPDVVEIVLSLYNNQLPENS